MDECIFTKADVEFLLSEQKARFQKEIKSLTDQISKATSSTIETKVETNLLSTMLARMQKKAMKNLPKSSEKYDAIGITRSSLKDMLTLTDEGIVAVAGSDNKVKSLELNETPLEVPREKCDLKAKDGLMKASKECERPPYQLVKPQPNNEEMKNNSKPKWYVEKEDRQKSYTEQDLHKELIEKIEKRKWKNQEMPGHTKNDQSELPGEQLQKRNKRETNRDFDKAKREIYEILGKTYDEKFQLKQEIPAEIPPKECNNKPKVAVKQKPELKADKSSENKELPESFDELVAKYKKILDSIEENKLLLENLITPQ